MTSRPSTAAPFLAVLAILAALLGLYVVLYLWLGPVARVTTPAGPVAVRIFRNRWQAVLFTPAASAESFVSRSAVEVFSNEEVSQLQ